MITNGKDVNLCNTPTELPDVSQGVNNFLQRVKLGLVQKQQVNGYTQEVIVYNYYQATKQPMSEDLAIQMEGERSWKWYEIHTTPELVLETDDVIYFGGLRYRVMKKLDYKEYGYVNYHVIEDYQNTVTA